MKSKHLSALLLLCALSVPVQAQTTDATTEKSPQERLNDFLASTKKGLQKTGKVIGEFLGIDDGSDSDDVVIGGVKYMPIQTTDLMGNDGADLRKLCTDDFTQRYPKATISSVVIPQKSWTETAVKSGSKIKYYRRRAYCYILAKDGADGYIHTRYSFVMQRKAGQEWVKLSGYWPNMDRADMIPLSHYLLMTDK